MESILNKADACLGLARDAVTRLYLAFDPEDYCGEERMDECAKRALDAMTRAAAEILELLEMARCNVLLPQPAKGFKWAVVVDEDDCDESGHHHTRGGSLG